MQEKLTEIRKKLSLSQEELASRLGVSFATVNRWENGKTAIRKSAKEKIDKLYDEVLHIDETVDTDMSSQRSKRGVTRSQVLSTQSMEQMLWSAACSIRGAKDAPKFKDYILPLLFIKRLSDVFDDEVKRVADGVGSKETALELIRKDKALVRFYIPPSAKWSVVSGEENFKWPKAKRPNSLGEQLTLTMRDIVKANPNHSLSGVIDIVDYNASLQGEREISDAALRGVIDAFSNPRYRLGLRDVEPDFLGRAYEYLLRKFAEDSGQSAGEFFTPREVGFVMAKILRPQGGETAYDFACGSFGLLVKLQLVLKENDPLNKKPLKLYGQELGRENFALGCMNKVLHDIEGDIQRGDSMENPKFKTKSGRLKTYDIVIANPMWNQPFDTKIYENDPWERFENYGGFTSGKGDWAWVQVAAASLNSKGRAAIVLDTGAVTRGSGSKHDDKEKLIRKWFVEQDLIEGVILFPENLFYNTTAAGIIVFLNKQKSADKKGKIILLNASQEFYKGRPKNHISDESIEKITQAFIAGKDQEKFVKVITIKDAEKNDYNLSPSRYISLSDVETYREIPDILTELKTLHSQSNRLDKEMNKIISMIELK
ncbi:MAG: N-6 DNA methylase [Chromatiales bacterium]|nr:N-6 DNA methylase [Chromatiales bacterium]